MMMKGIFILFYFYGSSIRNNGGAGRTKSWNSNL